MAKKEKPAVRRIEDRDPRAKEIARAPLLSHKNAALQLVRNRFLARRQAPISRSALSRMNDERSADFFKDVFQQILQLCKALALGSQFKLPHISPKDQHDYHFITNAMHLSAQTIADVYKERWQIELFFKWVKQNLKIKTFLGTSANAVMTQVWIALCLYLILAFLRFISKTVHSMREILNWIRINLFSNEILDDYLVPKMTEAIANPQLALF